MKKKIIKSQLRSYLTNMTLPDVKTISLLYISCCKLVHANDYGWNGGARDFDFGKHFDGISFVVFHQLLLKYLYIVEPRGLLDLVDFSTMKEHVVGPVGLILALLALERFGSCVYANMLRKASLSCKAFSAVKALKFTVIRVSTGHMLSQSSLTSVTIATMLAYHVSRLF